MSAPQSFPAFTYPTPFDPGIRRLGLIAPVAPEIGTVVVAGSDLATNGHRVMKDSPQLQIVPDAQGAGMPMPLRMFLGAMLFGTLFGGALGVLVLGLARSPAAAGAVYLVCALGGAWLGRSLFSLLPLRMGNNVIVGTEGVQCAAYSAYNAAPHFVSTGWLRHQDDGALVHGVTDLRKNGEYAGQLEVMELRDARGAQIAFVHGDKWLVSAAIRKALQARADARLPAMREAIERGGTAKVPVFHNGQKIADVVVDATHLTFADKKLARAGLEITTSEGMMTFRSGGVELRLSYAKVGDVYALYQLLTGRPFGSDAS